MSRSDFDWKIVEILQDERAVQVVEVVDLDLGNMSVTNDVENVILEIAKILPRPPTDFAWIYADSTGAWDELVLDHTGNFKNFAALPRGRCHSELQAEAVVRLLARELEAGT